MRINVQFCELLASETNVSAGVWRNPANLTFALYELEPKLASIREDERLQAQRRLAALYAMVVKEAEAHFGPFDVNGELPQARTLASVHLPRLVKTLHLEMVRNGLLTA